MPIFRGKNFVSANSDYKDSVRVATRSNVNLNANILSVDGVSLSSSNRILLVGQTDLRENGIYYWNASTQRLARAFDADSIFELSAGNKVYVEEGNSFAKTTWTLITQGVITPGSTNLVFAKESRIASTDISGTYGSATKTLQIVVDETGKLNAVTEYNIDTTLDSLSDVVLTNPTSGQVLKYNGTNWVNGTDYTGAGGESSGISLTDISATNAGGFGSISYNNATGVITHTGVSANEIRSQFSVVDAGGDGSFSYDSATGAFTYTGPSAAEARAHLSATSASGVTYNSSTGIIALSAIPNSSLANSSITINDTNVQLGGSNSFSTSAVSEGTNLYFLDSRARASISAVDAGGDGSFSYDSATGAFTYTGPSASEVRDHFSAGTGLTYTPGQFAVDATIVTLTDTQTLTNKRVNPRVGNNGATLTGTINIDADLFDQFNIIGITDAITVAAPTGTPVDGQKLMIRIEDAGAAEPLTWTTGTSNSYRVIGSTLPTTTVAGKTIYVGCIYNAADQFWDVIAVAQQT